MLFKKVVFYKAHFRHVLASMVQRKDSSDEEEFRIGDRVRVSSRYSTYRGRYGTIVMGKTRSGFTSTFLSAYVLFDQGSLPYTIVRLESLERVPVVSVMPSTRQTSVAATVSNLNPTRRELVCEMCAQLESLDLRSQAESDDIIRIFAETVLGHRT